MRQILCAILLALALLMPCSTAAAEFKIGLNFARDHDGSAYSELWYDGRMVWRLKLIPDGATPVVGGAGSNSIVLIPDIDSGFFVLKIYSQ